MIKKIALLVVIVFTISTFCYQKSSAVETWTKVDIPFGGNDNIAIGSESDGSYVYVGTFGEPGQLWRSSNGESWTQIVSDGFGDPDNEGIVPGLSVDLGFLGLGTNFQLANYASTLNEHGTQIWQKQADDSWTNVVDQGFGDANNILTGQGIEYNNQLYVSTWNSETGTEIWRTSNGTSWEQTNIDGFGNAYNFYSSSMISYNGYLFCFTGNWLDGAQIWRTSNGTSWEQITQSGLTDELNWAFQSAVSYNNELYLGTFNIFGGQLWKTSDGTTWTQITGPGFLKPENMGINPNRVANGYFYLSTYNIILSSPGLIMKKLGRDFPGSEKIKPEDYGFFDSNGTEVWATNNGTSWAQLNEGGFGDTENMVVGDTFVIGDYLFVITVFSDTFFTSIGNELWKMKLLSTGGSSDTSSSSSSSSSSKDLSTLPRTGAHY